MNFFFKIYLNKKSGLGHLARCLILAEQIPKSSKVYFLVDNILDIKKLIKTEREIKFINLYNGGNNFKSEIMDLKIFIKKTFNLKKSIVILDDYRLGYFWTKKIYDKINKKYNIKMIVKNIKEMNNIDLCGKTFQLPTYYDKYLQYTPELIIKLPHIKNFYPFN